MPPPLTITPRLLRRGLEVFALISILGVIGLLFYGNNFPVFISTILHLRWEWLVVGLALASMDWVGGGFRLWVVTRHVHPGVRLADMVLAAGMGAWGSYVTPFQAGSSPMAIWRMTKAGVRVPEAMTSVFITFVATVAFLATAGPLAIIFGAGRSLAEHGILLGITLFDLFKTSLTAFVLIGVAMFAAIVFPRAVRNFVHWVAVTVGRRNARLRTRMEQLSAGIDRAHDCMVAFRSPKGLLTLVWATIISGPSHANKLLAGYVALRALGIHADFVDVLLLQTFISFMLYFAPTPGGSGFAEVISTLVMSIYVTDPALIPAYILIWRFINTYATVTLGTALFWSWLRRGLIGKEEAVAT